MMSRQKRPKASHVEAIELFLNGKGAQSPQTSTRSFFENKLSCAKWIRFMLMVIYACLFVLQMLYLPQSYSTSLGRGPYIPYSMPPAFSVDILSVASINRTENLEVQQRTIASHISVRNFFNATELDDYDPTCYKDLTWEQVKQVSEFCKNRRGKKLSYEFRFMRNQYARWQWLAQKPNPTGWLCAIQRPYAGLRKAYSHYRKYREHLPDYFIIFDDDSYYNMEIFQKEHENLNSSQPTVVAGCLVRSPVRQLNFTFPFGGFGAVFSKGSLRYLFHPIVCPDIDLGKINGTIPMFSNHPNYEGICAQLSKNVMLERKYFKNGDSLLDLIYKYVNTERYRDVAKWTTGFCMHSDWVMGYFVNFYNASIHVKDSFFDDVPHARIESYKGSEIYARGTGFCTHERKCPDGTAICHKPDIRWVESEASKWPRKNHTVQTHR